MSLETIRAEKDLKELFYSGENYPNMWLSFLDWTEARNVHSNDMKLPILQDTRLAEIPMTMIFETAMHIKTRYNKNIRRNLNTTRTPRRGNKTASFLSSSDGEKEGRP